MKQSSRIALVLILVIVLLGTVLGYAESNQLMTRWQVTLVFGCLTLVGIVVGTTIAYTQLGFAAEQIRLAVEKTEAERRKNRQDRALTYSLMYYPNLLDAFQKLDLAFPAAGCSAPVCLDDLGDDHRKYLYMILAHWENLALTIKHGTTDEEMAFDMTAQGLVQFCRRFTAFIIWRQTINSRAYVNLQRLVAAWEDRLAREASRPAK